jgi:hypothetical protein
MSLIRIKNPWIRRSLLSVVFVPVVFYVVVRDAVTTVFDCWSVFGDAWRGR